MNKIYLDESKNLLFKFWNISDITVSGFIYITLLNNGEERLNQFPFSITDTIGTLTNVSIDSGFTGKLISATVSITTPNINEGQFFCSFEIYQNSYTQSQIISNPFAEYVTSQKSVGYPFSVVKSPQDTVGNIVSVAIPFISDQHYKFINSKNRIINIQSLYCTITKIAGLTVTLYITVENGLQASFIKKFTVTTETKIQYSLFNTNTDSNTDTFILSIKDKFQNIILKNTDFLNLEFFDNWIFEDVFFTYSEKIYI